MGAVTWISTGLYTERWYTNPDYNTTLPAGTAGYGASAEKLRDKFIIKYYTYDENGNDIVEIPKHDMWLIKHNGKRFNVQDDDSLFYYILKNEIYLKSPNSRAIANFRKLLPIKKCNIDKWCELYPTYDGQTLYVKKLILLKRLSDK
jgi:hypothetical protein